MWFITGHSMYSVCPRILELTRDVGKLYLGKLWVETDLKADGKMCCQPMHLSQHSLSSLGAWEFPPCWGTKNLMRKHRETDYHCKLRKLVKGKMLPIEQRMLLLVWRMLRPLFQSISASGHRGGETWSPLEFIIRTLCVWSLERGVRKEKKAGYLTTSLLLLSTFTHYWVF